VERFYFGKGPQSHRLRSAWSAFGDGIAGFAIGGKMLIADIIVGERHRKDLGDIKGLARSIADVGLLHPGVVRSDGVLIAGQRRIAAAKLLGWTEIPATVVDLESIIRGEQAENVYRKDFTPSEAVAIGRALEPMERAAAKDRMVAAHASSENFSGLQKGEALAKVATAVGMSRPTYIKAKQVAAAAEADPERFGDLVAEMDRKGKVGGAYRKLRRAQDADTLAAIQPPTGKFRTIVIDPPWHWGDEGDVSQMGRSRPTYATIPIAELHELPIPDLATDNCHIYLWITNRSLPKGFALLEAWGFRYVTTLTWCKPSIGIGNYFRNNTEHILFGVKGKLALLKHDQATWFAAPRGPQHSSKPDEAYRIIARCSPEPRLNMFSRQEREGFTRWGNS